MAGDTFEPGRLPLPPRLSPHKHRRSAHRADRIPHPHRWLTIVAGAVSVVVLASSAFAFGYYEKLNGNVHRVSVFPNIPKPNRPAKAKDGAENILLVGSDSRAGATKEQLKTFNTTDDGGGLNTDTIILLHISPDNVVTMVSFPRDSWVSIPGHGQFKINAAYADGEADHKGGGPALLTETVENLSHVHIDHYIEVGFYQFITISNAIGGVRVCIQSANGKGAHEKNSGINLPEGYSTISGSQALAFVRQRYGLPGGDLDRIKRQQRFVSAMVAKVKTIRNPITLNAFLEKATSSLTVDSGLSGMALIKLADRLKNVAVSDIHFATVPLSAKAPPKYGSNGQQISYIQLDTAALPGFFATIAQDGAPSAPTSAPASTVDPSSVTVDVRNGRGTAGAASDAARSLQTYGYHVASTGNSSRSTTTTIRYAGVQVAAARTLARAVQGAQLVADDSLGSTIVLTLGADDVPITDPAGVPAVTVSASPSSTPTASPAPSHTAADPLCGV